MVETAGNNYRGDVHPLFSPLVTHISLHVIPLNFKFTSLEFSGITVPILHYSARCVRCLTHPIFTVRITTPDSAIAVV